ncbi:pro-neuregulin-3, membrane-bound isoform-like [Tupaia chinensis]|uniref:pro-neuregulin-3, membrane-bound isoform-like n=1 Tax=Tupaia chinensis TaxID=246437 RepID=UPI000FFB73DE|nr:pro-neuregulin-3, membrane-bound isoform-like [Tupaia chinensis]
MDEEPGSRGLSVLSDSVSGWGWVSVPSSGQHSYRPAPRTPDFRRRRRVVLTRISVILGQSPPAVCKGAQSGGPMAAYRPAGSVQPREGAARAAAGSPGKHGHCPVLRTRSSAGAARDTTTYSTERSEHFKPCRDKDLAYCLNDGECFVIETLTGSHKHCRPYRSTADDPKAVLSNCAVVGQQLKPSWLGVPISEGPRWPEDMRAGQY